MESIEGDTTISEMVSTGGRVRRRVAAEIAKPPEAGTGDLGGVLMNLIFASWCSPWWP
jgi:hypothetical protein